MDCEKKCNGCQSDQIISREFKLSNTTSNKQNEGIKDFVEIEMRSWNILYFSNRNNIKLSPDDMVIVEAERGQDIGRVLHTSIKNKELDTLFDQGKIMNVIRNATENDITNLDELIERETLAKNKFLETVHKYPFELKLLDTIYQYDGNKVTFFYTADGRIDFREFVKELAQIFKTRIEMHQCTGRDEAKRIGGYGTCGNMYCCTSFMKRFNQVTIKMAKDQNLVGNLSKTSGPCGRLLCCLHYEEEYYSETAKEFPAIGDQINRNNKKMYVYRNDLYSKNVYIASESQEIKIISLDEYNKCLLDKNKP